MVSSFDGKTPDGSPTDRMGSKKASAKKKSSTPLKELLEMDLESRGEFFSKSPVAELVAVVEESYASELVNLWLDLKKSVVRDMFQRVMNHRKRVLLPALTLYHYKEYLTNPLPLMVTGGDRERISNYYALVGLPREALPEDVKEAHKLLQLAYDQDGFAPTEREIAAERLKEINEAFAVLKNEKKRAEADARMPTMPYLYPGRDQSWLEAVRRYL